VGDGPGTWGIPPDFMIGNSAGSSGEMENIPRLSRRPERRTNESFFRPQPPYRVEPIRATGGVEARECRNEVGDRNAVRVARLVTRTGSNCSRSHARERSRRAGLKRARILLRHQDNPSSYAVETAVGVTDQAALDDQPQPGKEPEITVQTRAWLVSLACQGQGRGIPQTDAAKACPGPESGQPPRQTSPSSP
jgi:hypothetical protein